MIYLKFHQYFFLYFLLFLTGAYDLSNLNKILNREQQKDKIKSWCKQFELNKSKLDIKRGLYVFGLSGIGKTLLKSIPKGYFRFV